MNKKTTIKVVCGDALSELRKLPTESVQLIVTSPPYYALRDYGKQGQIGLEPTHQEYISRLLAVLHEAMRVLKPDGVMFVNIADSYSGSGNGTNSTTDESASASRWAKMQHKPKGITKKSTVPHKSQICIPERLKIGMVEAGFIARSTIIWHKPSCMPESVTDRFTNDFEYVFMFTKNKRYKFNQLTEPIAKSTYERVNRQMSSDKATTGQYRINTEKSQVYAEKVRNGLLTERNMRAVWQISPQANRTKHYAVFPEKLVERLINAGSNHGDTVLDPFAGSGTTGVVAKRMRRNFIGIDLNPEYCKIMKNRL